MRRRRDCEAIPLFSDPSLLGRRELLGPAENRGPATTVSHDSRLHAKTADAEIARGHGYGDSAMTETLSKDLRADFRALAGKIRRGMLRYDMDGEDSPWRASRRALLLGAGAFSADSPAVRPEMQLLPKKRSILSRCHATQKRPLTCGDAKVPRPYPPYGL